MQMRSYVALSLALLLGATAADAAPSARASEPRAHGVAFEENLGQGPQGTRFLARGAEGALAFGDDGVAVFRTKTGPAETLRLSFPGARPGARPAGEAALPGHVNYLRGADRSRWVRGARTYGAVAYRGLYPGIDVRFHAERGPLEYDVLVAPGAKPDAFALRVDGARRLSIDAQGRLVAETDAAAFVQDSPIAWQQVEGGRDAVDARFELRADGTVGLRLGAYDGSRALVIDPTLSWANFLGGALRDEPGGNGMVAAADGGLIVVGTTSSTDFPTAGWGTGGAGYSDAFVAKFSADGSALVWSTYLGGSLNDGAFALTLDAAGNVIVGGWSYSADFPVTAGAFQTTNLSTPTVGSAFLVKLDPSGGQVLYGTFVGGVGGSNFLSLKMGPSGRVYAAGWGRADYPTTAGAYDRTHNGGTTTPNLTLVVMDLGGHGAADLLYGTYLSGDLSSRAYDVAVDAAGDAHLTGTANTYLSTKKYPVVNFPTTSNAFIPTLSIPRSSSFDCGFYVKMRPGGAGTADLKYSTWICPKQAFGEMSQGVCVSASGIAYVAGGSFADSGFTTTTNAYDRTQNGHRDATLCAFDATKSGAASRTYATFVGGDGQDQFEDVSLDASGRLLLTGFSGYNFVSVVYPTTTDAVQRTYQGEGDVVVSLMDLTKSGSQQLVYSTLFGGSGGTAASGRGDDWGRTITPTPDGGFAVAALFESMTSFPSGVSWPYDGSPNGDVDVVVLRFGP